MHFPFSLFLLLTLVSSLARASSLAAEYTGEFEHPSAEIDRRRAYCGNLISWLSELTRTSPLPAKQHAVARREAVRHLSLERGLAFLRAMDIATPERQRRLIADYFPSEWIELQFTDLGRMGQLLADPVRRIAQLRVPDEPPASDSVRIRDRAELQPLEAHSILRRMMRGDAVAADAFGKELAMERGLSGAELLFYLSSSYADLRFRLTPFDGRYTEPEATRASVVLARTWIRRSVELKAAVRALSFSDPLTPLAADLLNLVETVYPMTTVDMVPTTVAMLAGSAGGEANEAALLHLWKVHRSWVEMSRLASDFLGRLTLAPWELSAISVYPLGAAAGHLSVATAHGPIARPDLWQSDVLALLASFAAKMQGTSLPSVGNGEAFPELARDPWSATKQDSYRAWVLNTLAKDAHHYRRFQKEYGAESDLLIPE